MHNLLPAVYTSFAKKIWLIDLIDLIDLVNTLNDNLGQKVYKL